MIHWWLVFLGGGLGSLLRFALARWLVQPGPHFPWATFWANLVSCALLGVLVGLRQKGVLLANAQYLLMTGLCGGFSTFSTFSLETLNLLEQEHFLLAALYLVLSISLGLLLVFLGIKVTLAL
jgi:CrcB protein